MLFETVPVTSAKQNCSVLWCESSRRAAVIDPGGDLYFISNILELLELDLELILLTHGHSDHAGGAAELARETGARIEGPHRGDAHLLIGSGAFGVTHHGGENCFTPSRWLEHGDIVQFGDERLDVLHCPGHTAGHVAYFSRSARWAFVGDILFRGAIGAWRHGDGDLKQLLTSIRHRLLPLGDDVQFVPGHGPTSTFGHERLHNPFVGEEAIAAWKSKRHSQPTDKLV